MVKQPKIPRIKLEWDYDRAYYKDYFVFDIAKGSDLNPDYETLCRMGSARSYDSRKWYGTLSSYDPVKGKFVTRDMTPGLGETRTGLIKKIEQYIARDDIDNEMEQRRLAYKKIKDQQKYLEDEKLRILKENKKAEEERIFQEEIRMSELARLKLIEEERQAELKKIAEERQKLIDSGLFFDIEQYSPKRVLMLD